MAKEVRLGDGWEVSQDQQAPWIAAIKMIREQISFANRLAHQSTASTNKRWQWRTQAEHSRLKSGPPFMRRLCIDKNIPVSGTKLTLGLRVGFSSYHLTVNKLFRFNQRAITGPPKMSLLLEAKSIPALIIKPRLILVSHTDDLGWNKTSNQQQQMLILNLKRIVSKCPNNNNNKTVYTG